MRLVKVENDFYRDNFKELTKVSTERKIKYYTEDYRETLPNVESKLDKRNAMIAYWKQWQSSVAQSE